VPPVRIDVDAAGQRWLPYAKSKLKQFKDLTSRLGVPINRKIMKVDNATIHLFTSNLFDKIRIESGVATFFRLYSRAEVAPDFSQIWQHTALLGISDSGDMLWRYDFPTYDAVADGVISRTLLGCSSDGKRLLVLETEADLTGAGTLTIKVFRGKALESSHTFALSAQTVIDGYTFAGGSNFKAFVSTDGTRALIQGLRHRVDAGTTEAAWVYYGVDLVPTIQPLTIPISALYISATPTCGGSADLSTVWLARERWEQQLVGTAPEIEIRKVEYIPRAGETPSSLKSTSLAFPTFSGPNHAVATNHFAFGTDGSFAVVYNLVTPGDFSATAYNTVDSRVLDSAGNDYSVRYADTIAYSDIDYATYQFTLSSLTRDARAFVLQDQGYDLLSNDYSTVIDRVKTAFVPAEVPVGISPDTGNVAVRFTGVTHVIRREGTDYDLGTTGSASDEVYMYPDATQVLMHTVFAAFDLVVMRWAEQLGEDFERVGYPVATVLGKFTKDVLSPSALDPETTVSLSVTKGVTKHTQIFLAAG